MEATPTADIQQRLESLCRDIFDEDALVLRREMTARDVRGWDSLSNIQLILAVQKEFKIAISASQAMRLTNVGDLIDLICSKMRAHGD